MLVDYLSYPSGEEWRKIAGEISLNKLSVEINFPSPTKAIDLIVSQERKDWLMLFNNRLGEVRQTYIFLTHYYNMGIPDDNWHKSPGDNGESIQYYTEFEDKHYYIKHMYDYYADILYFKFISAWDTLSHFYNVYYEFKISIKYISRYKVLDRIEKINPDLYECIRGVQDSEAFNKFIEQRNDITHNFSPSQIDSGIKRYNNGSAAFSIGKYTTTRERQNNIVEVIKMTIKFLDEIKIIFERHTVK
ncbi:Cthe_2314 family HEPN domain-containing protein [Paenibacillus radicis (ex Gao et al. 2016)]|uniref:Cthe-2314-like HEPN domain-containing protein n=1 Tax=Paenibacillus radicis (ex Gao et al. 2016) TaxID=1737354 RepID=A0A917HS79_9BACL|nr:Cthe_2314 family HEPN domain-containing protein [Paenibacillus radicis (ex Gao et al. 2016)]GGG88737.1 hypothetical protein GCM10010918_54210 [Paenibacillus radicis (ex Gao et al. 2016)]